MNILFLCRGNSARSILGEVIFNELFSQYGRSYSAGSNPVGRVNPMALEVLREHGHNIEGLRSQNISDFVNAGAPVMDVVVSVCDNAVQDCVVWPGVGSPKRVHWPLDDPALVEDVQEKRFAFEYSYRVLKDKIGSMVMCL